MDEGGAQRERPVGPVSQRRIDPAEHRLGQGAAVGPQHRPRPGDIVADGDVGQAHSLAQGRDLARQGGDIVQTGRRFTRHRRTLMQGNFARKADPTAP